MLCQKEVELCPHLRPRRKRLQSIIAHKENIASLACRVKKEQAEKFKAYCEAQEKTSNAVLREFVMRCIGENENAAE